MNSSDDEQTAADLVGRLAEAFPDARLSYIEQLVRSERAAFEDTPVRAYVPVLVERRVRAVLRTTGVARSVLDGLAGSDIAPSSRRSSRGNSPLT